MCNEITWQKAIHVPRATQFRWEKLISKFLFSLSFYFSRTKCMRKKIVYFPAKGATGTAGEYYEGNRVASRRFIKDTLDRFSECLVCQELWRSTAIRTTGAVDHHYGKVLNFIYFVNFDSFDTEVWKILFLLHDSGSVMILLKFAIDIRTWYKQWPKVLSKWKNRAVKMSNHRWNYQFNIFWIDCTCHASVFVC